MRGCRGRFLNLLLVLSSSMQPGFNVFRYGSTLNPATFDPRKNMFATADPLWGVPRKNTAKIELTMSLYAASLDPVTYACSLSAGTV